MSMFAGAAAGASSFWLTFIVPFIIGIFLAILASVGLVYSQTSAPSSNPADKAILTYGES